MQKICQRYCKNHYTGVDPNNNFQLGSKFATLRVADTPLGWGAKLGAKAGGNAKAILVPSRPQLTSPTAGGKRWRQKLGTTLEAMLVVPRPARALPPAWGNAEAES